MARDREVNIIVDAKNKSKRAFIEVKKDLKGLGDESKKGLGKISSAFDKTDKVLMSFADRMKGIDKVAKRTFQGTAAAASVYVGTTLRDFGQLNDGIAKVNTLYDQTNESQKKMYEDSLKMFKLLPTDFTKITQGIYDTISAGAGAEHATMFARKFGMAGVAGDADMDVVTKAAMGTMNAYKLEAKDLNKILDLQFMTVKKGITSYEEFASSLGTGVLASAEAAGITLEELQGSIAMITKNAIPASVATTSLNQMFNKFTDTKVIKEFKEFGVEIQDANRKTRPLIEIFKDLNYQFDRRKNTSEERKGFIKELVGSEQAARAIMPLIGDLKELENILDSMDSSSGAMRSAYDDRVESLKTQMAMFWNSLKGQGIEELYKLEPIMQLVMEPVLERQKIELDILELEDAMELEKDPMMKEMYLDVIAEVQANLEKIEIAPVDEFRDALSESVAELNKFSPAVGGAVDTLGNFILDFMGEEGKENRDKAGKIAKGAWHTYLLSLVSRTFKNVTGKSPMEAGKYIIPKAFQLGKGAMETGYLHTLTGMEMLGTAGAGAIALPLTLAAGAGGFVYYNYNHMGPNEELVKNLEEQAEMHPALQRYKNAYTGELKLDNVNKHNDNDKVDRKQFDSAMNLINTSLVDELLKMNKLQEKIDNTVNMENRINIDPPQVDVTARVYIDGTNIPTQRVEFDYRQVERQEEVQSRRYGNPNVMKY